MPRKPSRLNFPLALAVVALGFPASAFSADHYGDQRGFYLGLGGGLNVVHETDFEGGAISDDVDFDPGWAAIGTVGFRFSEDYRAELELSHRENDIEHIGGVGGDGDVRAEAAMVNFLVDFPNYSRFVPYMGVGAGAVWIDLNDASPVGGSSINDDIIRPAIQGIIGASYKMTNKVDLFADYRLLAAINPEFTTASGTDVDMNYDNSTVLVGLRYNFGGAPVKPREAAAAPAPTTTVTREVTRQEITKPENYQVFFAFDSSELTVDAKQTLATAAENVRNGSISRINVTGHADRAGGDKYNMKLSQRRASVVKAELVRLGLDVKEIFTAAKGESEPLVPTKDGVPEPQNRRVEIMTVYTDAEGNTSESTSTETFQSGSTKTTKETKVIRETERSTSTTTNKE